MRGGRGTGAGRSSAPAPERASLLRRRGSTIITATSVVVAVAAVIVAVVVTADAGEETRAEKIDDRVAELRAAEQERNAEVVVDLTDMAVSVHGDLVPMLDTLNAALPVDEGTSPVPATPGDVERWRSTVKDALATFGNPPSASTDINTARSGLMLAVELLGSSVDAYGLALDAQKPERARLEQLASDLRTQAVDAWAVASTKLDVLNVDAGHGHVHVYLPKRPGEEAQGPHGNSGESEH
ncbi:hypothetical protein [Haloactinopolyspora alba]|uniref:hypothetical protein n=1 Tax=Haloactinopolyspora alba TaxID=648780 RepID=UPI000D0D6657|nr:hypothetical protein [Haloactinopolyspora alba]